jgi:ketosteroid isomerase-like protein
VIRPETFYRWLSPPILTDDAILNTKEIQVSQSKKDIVKKINDSFASGSSDGFLEFCTDDITWNMVGEPEVKGKQAVREFMASNGGMEPPKFTVDKIVAEGDSAVCWGDMTMGNDAFSYCDVYTFDGDMVRELRAFVVKHKSADAENKSASA